MIINMAVSDLLVICMGTVYMYVIFVDPFASFDDRNDNRKLIAEVIICKLVPFFHLNARLVSLMSLLIISIERYKAIRITVPRIRSRSNILKHRVIAVCCSWLIPMAVTAYEPTYGVLKPSKDGGFECGLSHSPKIWISVYYLCMIITFVSIFLLSVLTWRKLSKPNEISCSLSELQRKSRAKRMAGAVRMVLCSIFLYCCCYLPLIFLQISELLLAFNGISIFGGICIDQALFEHVGREILPLFNSCLSPFIYIIFLSDFRSAAKRILCKCSMTATNPQNRTDVLPHPRQQTTTSSL